jgi:hypothetical protein
MPKRKAKESKPAESEEHKTILGVSPEKILLKGPMQDLSKMKMQELRDECQMWRNVWGWVPPEVKYYVARVGQQVAITMRNYKRYLGVLLDTHWDLLELELGVLDKVYDTVDGKTYFERKIVKTRLGGIMDLQWIKERVEAESEETLAAPSAETQSDSPSTPNSENGGTVG